MIDNIPESLKDKLKDVDLSKLEQRILDAKEIKSETLGYYQEVLKRFNKERKDK